MVLFGNSVVADISRYAEMKLIKSQMDFESNVYWFIKKKFYIEKCIQEAYHVVRADWGGEGGWREYKE